MVAFDRSMQHDAREARRRVAEALCDQALATQRRSIAGTAHRHHDLACWDLACWRASSGWPSIVLAEPMSADSCQPLGLPRMQGER